MLISRLRTEIVVNKKVLALMIRNTSCCANLLYSSKMEVIDQSCIFLKQPTKQPVRCYRKEDADELL